MAPWPAPRPVAERAIAEGWGSLQKAGTFTSSDTPRQTGQLQNWVLCLNNLVSQQRLPERARLKAGKTRATNQVQSGSSRYLQFGMQLPPTVWPQPPNSAPSPCTGPCWVSVPFWMKSVLTLHSPAHLTPPLHTLHSAHLLCSLHSSHHWPAAPPGI